MQSWAHSFIIQKRVPDHATAAVTQSTWTTTESPKTHELQPQGYMPRALVTDTAEVESTQDACTATKAAAAVWPNMRGPVCTRHAAACRSLNVGQSNFDQPNLVDFSSQHDLTSHVNS